jgi:hypothetical protein
VTDLPTPNIPLLRKAVEWAEAEAAKTEGPCMWDQGDYFSETDCGTAYCISGFVIATQSGFALKEDRPLINGRDVGWWDGGRELLGLTEDEALDLFAPYNTIEDVRRLAEQIAARAGERL